jgi:O-glycosyl hydrolase
LCYILGACDENAWVIVNRHNEEGLLTLWGINDPDGTYTVVHMEYDQNDAKQKAHQATNMALTYASVEVEPEEKPVCSIPFS